MNKLIYSGMVAAIFSITACNNDNNNDGNPDTNGTFHAVIDGSAWDADADAVGFVVADYGSGLTIAITGTKAADTAHFFFTFPYFTASDTVITEPSSDTDLRFQDNGTLGGGLWLEETGTLDVTRTTQDGIETLTGTFSGTFVDPFDSTSVKTVTGGTFTAKRLI
ncbi:MAG: hypothetical protein POELPBGB_00206 [Bacteroidia bacterium]|nr:hypothetical protein [Bacteroidia bacterium]